ncbi:Qat anti-phage system associated protein QatB, partial [Mesorhizobium sp. M5C.F.Ca.IN.020.32.2.1]
PPGQPGATPVPAPSGTPPNPVPVPQPLPPLASPAAGKPLGSARSDFSRAARSRGGGGRDLRRAAGKYVRAMGGARNAARAMAPSRRVMTGLGQLLGQVAQNGPAAALRFFNLQSLVGAPIADVFLALTDLLCPDGGTIDEAIARNAMLETVGELGAAGDLPFDGATPDVLDAVFTGALARSIETKLFNEIGGRSIRLPTDVAAVEIIQRTLHDFIQGTVRDRFAAAGGTLASVPYAGVEAFVQAIYEQSFELIRILGDSA